MLRKIQRTDHYLRQKLMRHPNTEEIAAEIGISSSEVNTILNLANNMLSLEAESSSEEKAVSVADMYEDYTYSPERELIRRSVRDDTIRCVNRLKERERLILIYRFQLNNGERYTLKKIGTKMGISPETVRQIEIKALQKMRFDAAELQDFMMLEAM